MTGFKKTSCGVAIALPIVLGGCGPSAYPDSGPASNPCHFVDRNPPAGAIAMGLPAGCINAANLGALVAEPDDLTHGRTLAPADGERAARDIADYQAGMTKGAPTPPTGVTTGGAP